MVIIRPKGQQKNKANSKHAPSTGSGLALSEVEWANFKVPQMILFDCLTGFAAVD